MKYVIHRPCNLAKGCVKKDEHCKHIKRFTYRLCFGKLKLNIYVFMYVTLNMFTII